MSGDHPRTTLMPVKIWGSVAKPGIHYVPVDTKLTTLLSLAGGPDRFVELDDDLIIKREEKGKRKVLELSMEDLIDDPETGDIRLAANDMIYVPFADQAISDTALRTFSIIASIVGITLSAVLIADRL